MATAIATRYEILEDKIARGERHVRYRWTMTGGTTADGLPMGESSGIESAMERVEPMPRELLLDRWHGLMGSDDWTELGERLGLVLTELSDGLTRRSVSSPETVRVDDGVSIRLDEIMDIDGLIEAIRDWLIERAAKVAAA